MNTRDVQRQITDLNETQHTKCKWFQIVNVFFNYKVYRSAALARAAKPTHTH